LAKCLKSIREGNFDVDKHLQSLQIASSCLDFGIKVARTFRNLTRREGARTIQLVECVEKAMKAIIELGSALGSKSSIYKYPEWPKDTDFIFEGDPIELQQIVFNLLLNAVQQIDLFVRPKGIITVSLDKTELKGMDAARIRIKDTGPGIHPRDFARVFEEEFTTKKPDGTGLGLYIAKSIVEALGGTITVGTSILFVTTSFEIVLPCSIQTKQ
jgi:signal transduction histidine kinase